LGFFKNIIFVVNVKESLFETSFTSITGTFVPACTSVRLYVYFISHKSSLIVMSACAWPGQLFTGLVREGLVFDSRPTCVRLAMDKMTLGHVFLRARPLSCAAVIPTNNPYYSFIDQPRYLNFRN
jgi:hypothetical protein